MRLGANVLDLLKVAVIDVPVQPEQSLEDVLHHMGEVLRELDLWKQSLMFTQTSTTIPPTIVNGEYSRIGDLLVDPVEHELDVLGRANFNRLLDSVAIRPLQM